MQNLVPLTMASSLWSGILVISLVSSLCLEASGEGEEFVLTLDHTNFTETVAKHDFIVVEFYAPWCGHCQQLAPEYEKAASELSSHDPPIVLAKIDVNEEANRGLATEYEVQGFPTLKILRKGATIVQEYKGPRDADGIVSYLKKLLGPASAEIKSADDVANVFDEKKIFLVGIFPKFSGEEYDNFIKLADTLRSDYDFGHTLDAKHLPRGESVSKPTLRLFKPFDELYVDSQDFNVEAMEKFVQEASVPLVTIFDENPENHPYLNKFFESPNAKAMLFLNFSTERNAFESKVRDAAVLYKGKGISFLMGDAETSDNAFEYFGVSRDQAPLLIIHLPDGTKYFKPNIKPDEVAPFLKDYKDGKVKPYIRSEPIPEVNDEPVKVVVTDSLQDMVFNSGKNVLLEFYAPWCGHCKQLAPILEEVAVSFENDADVVIAKLDATANDVPSDTFDVQGYPTLYFRSAEGKLLQYDGERTKEDIIEFIQKNRDDKSSQSHTTEPEVVKADSIEQDLAKDEL